MKYLPRTAVALAAVAMAAAAWFFVAPPLLAGKTSFVIVRGTSMAPRFHGGDLVLLRRRPVYRVGQIVGYHSALLHRVVMHRIVAVRDGEFLFKGDNNAVADGAQPTERELIGRVWLRVPAVGSAISWEATPLHASIVALAATLLLLGGGLGSSQRRGRVRKVDRVAPTRDGPPTVALPASTAPLRLSTVRWAGGLAVAAGALAIAAVLLGVFALVAHSRPLTRTATVSDAYTIKGTFAYAARVPASAVYPSGRVTTHDPAFLRLVPSLDVTFAYRFASPLPHRIRGVAGMRAVLQSAQGWSRTFELAAAHPVAGDTGVISGRLHLDRLQRVLVSFQRQTGVPESAYTLTVTPTLELHGTVAGAPVSSSVRPSLPLGIDSYELRVAPGQTLGTGVAADPLVVGQSGSIARRAPADVSLLGLSASVPAARRGSLLGAGAALLLASIAGLLAYRGRRTEDGNEVLEIERAYGKWIVPIASAALRPEGMIVDVTSITSLARVAQHDESLIFHERREDGDDYLVEDRGTVYRYRLDRTSAGQVRPLLAAPDPRASVGSSSPLSKVHRT